MSQPRSPRRPPPLPSIDVRQNADRPKQVTLLIGVAVGLGIACLCLFVVFRSGGNGIDEFGDILARNQNTEPAKADPELERLKRESAEREASEKRQREEQLARENQEKAALAEQEAIARGRADEEARLKAKAELEREMAEEVRLNALHEEGPFAFVKASVASKDKQWHDEHGQWLFELPKPKKGNKSQPLLLRTISKPVTLRLWDGAKEELARSDMQLSLESDATVPGSYRLTSRVAAKGTHLGTYQLTPVATGGDVSKPDLQLEFEWARDAEREIQASELARWWPLEIEVGDQTQRAIFLQRRAVTPEPPPSTADVLAGKEYGFSGGDELKCLSNCALTGMKCEMQLTEFGQPPQSFPLEMSQEERAEGLADEDVRQAGNALYFPLATPLVLSDTGPGEQNRGLGFGLMQFWPRRSEQGFHLEPRITLRLKLPTTEHVADLPSNQLNEFLAKLGTINNDPEEFADAILSNRAFNPSLVDGEIAQLQRETADYFTDESRWYSQPLKSLPSRAFWKLKFAQLKKKVSSEAKSVEVSARKKAKGTSRTDDEDIDTLLSFSPSLDKLEKSVDESVRTLLAAYDEIQEQVKAVEQAVQQSQFCFRFSAACPSPGALSGDQVVLRFLDTHPQAERVRRN